MDDTPVSIFFVSSYGYQYTLRKPIVRYNIHNMKNGLNIRECSRIEYGQLLAKFEHTREAISFLQAPFYGAWQERDGKTVIYFVASEGKKTVAAGLAVRYDAPGGIRFLYCPYGPIVQTWTLELFEALRLFFAPIAKRTGAAFVRFDSRGMTDLPGIAPVANQLAVTASLQPRAEWLLDLLGDQEALWMGMHKHARYNIRLAERANARLAFYAPAEAPIDIFFNLMRTTAARDGFSIQSKKYYEAVLQSIPADSGLVAICTIDDKPAAASVFAAYDGIVHYVFSGSSNDFRKIAPPYFIIWNTILESRKRGWVTLSFGGITDNVKSTHLHGVTSFKKRFGGYQIDRPNPVDLIYKPFRYTLFATYKYTR